MPLKLTTYRQGNAIPELPGSDTFHSTELFHIYEATPGYQPIMIVATIDNRTVNYLVQFAEANGYRLPESSRNAKFMVPANTLTTRWTKKISLPTCYNALPMKPCEMPL